MHGATIRIIIVFVTCEFVILVGCVIRQYMCV